MKRLLFIIALVMLAASVSAVPIVRNNTSSLTAEDSVCFLIHNVDSLGQPRGGLDTTKVIVIGPSGDSLFGEVINGVTGRVMMKSTGSGAYDTTYYYKAQVSDIDGSGAAGVYTVRVTSVSNETGGWLRFAKSEQFQIVPVRPSVWAGAASLDSATAEKAAYAGARRFALDSTIRSDTLITELLDSLKARDSGLYSDDFWTSVVSTVAGAVWNALVADYQISNTMGDYMGFAGDPNNYPSLTEMNDSTWGLGTRTVASVSGAVGSVTGNVGGNVTGSVGSVVGAVGSVTGNVGGNVNGHVVGSIGGIVADIAEQIADVTQDSVGNASGGNATASLNEVLNPYFSMGTTDTVNFVSSPYSMDSSRIPGWNVTGYSVGSGSDDYVSIENSTFAVESTLTGGRMLVYKVQRTMTVGQLDSVRITSTPIKLYPGIYKFGIRHYTQGDHPSTGTALDSVVVDLTPVISPNSRLSGFLVPTSTSWANASAQYIATDTITVLLKIRGYGFRQTAPTEPAEWIAISQAFVTNMGANQWAVAAATARAVSGSVGDSLQKPIQVAVDVDETVIADAVLDEVISGHLTAGTLGYLAYRIDSVARAIKDTLSDGVNGPLVNVQAVGGDSSAANALSYAWDTTETGKASLTVQEATYGPARSLHNTISITQGAGNLPAVSIGQGDGSAAAVYISGGGNAVELEGGGTAGSGLVVSGSGGADDVQGVFFDSGAISIGDINLTLSGSGDYLVNIYSRDTSGVDNYVMDVDITIRPLGSTSTEAFLRTNDTGVAHFTLPAGTFEVLLRRPGYQFLPDTITVTGSANHTMDGYRISNANVATVYGCVRDLGMTTGRAYVQISMPDKKRNNCDSTLLLTNVVKEILTDSVGCFSFDDIPWSSCFGGSKYKVTIKPTVTTVMNIFLPGQAPREFTITVPDSVSYRVIF